MNLPPFGLKEVLGELSCGVKAAWLLVFQDDTVAQREIVSGGKKKRGYSSWNRHMIGIMLGQVCTYMTSRFLQ